MLVRRWMRGNVEVRLERPPYRHSHLAGLNVEDAVKQSFLLLKVSGSAVSEQTYPRDFASAQDDLVSAIVEMDVYKPSPRAVRAALFDLNKLKHPALASLRQDGLAFGQRA